MDVLEDISSFFLTCCNAIMKFAWAGWKMPVLCGNQIKGRKIRFVQAVFCNSKLTLQLSFAPDCSNEYFLEVALKARQSWVLHKTFAAAGGRTDNIQKISRRRRRECICWISKCIFVDYKMCLSKLQNIFVQIAKCICPNCKMYLSKLQNVFVQIEKCICPSSTQWKQSEGPDASNVFPQWNTQLSLCTWGPLKYLYVAAIKIPRFKTYLHICMHTYWNWQGWTKFGQTSH